MISESVLAAHRPLLLRFALIYLKQYEPADDLVQETLLAAWENADKHAKKSEIKTWLIGILKHKIADYWRHTFREAAFWETYPENETDDTQDGESFFTEDNQWVSAPTKWSNPEASLHDQQFWQIFTACQNNLPAPMAEIFMQRELVGLEPDEICKLANISPANYWVIMHRARLRLRECMELRWFNV